MKKTIAQQLNIKDFPFEIKDDNGKLIYIEDSNGNWVKSEYDSNSNEVYYENSYGIIRDTRPKEVILTLDEIADKFNIDVKNLKVKK